MLLLGTRLPAKRFRNALAVVLLLGIPLWVPAQDAREILSRYLLAVSNDSVAKWDGIRSAYMEQMGDFLSPNQLNQADFSMKKPNDERFYWVYPDKSKIEFLVDAVVTTSFFHTGGKDYMVMGNMPPHRLEPRPDFEFEPVRIQHLMDKARRLVCLGVRNFPTGDCYHIELATREDTHRLYINVDNFRLDYWSIMPPGADETLTRYDDYQQFGGLWFAMSRTTTKGGAVFNWLTIKKLVLNPEIPDSVFRFENK